MPLCRPVLFCRVPAQLVPFNSLCISFLWGTLKTACITRNAVTGVCLFAETFSVSFQKSKELSLVYYCQCGIFCLKNSEHPLIFFNFEVLLSTIRTNFKIHKSYRSYIQILFTAFEIICYCFPQDQITVYVLEVSLLHKCCLMTPFKMWYALYTRVCSECEPSSLVNFL